ncbi:hypothetical protein V5O48_004448 [Marasmius crinis-equi]|uniref:Mitochondrial distribution and morphology protein 10 n=1 Tax=Marasmius crinis-equi TaxID=585013 RepID=A0ABR3FQ48_9AGAR
MLKPRLRLPCSAPRAIPTGLVTNTRSVVSKSSPTSPCGPHKQVFWTSYRKNHVFSSELGLRTDLPPDSLNATGGSSDHSPKGNMDRNEPEEVSDREWEVRTGRAIDIIIHTLPDFFHVGLLTSIDKNTGEPQPTSSIHIPVVNTNPLDYRRRNSNLELLYSPKVRLSYTPPMELPAPFPKTLKIEGLPLYIASSAFVRHTLNALYSDLQVTIHKVSVNTPKSGNPPYDADSPPQTPSMLQQTSKLSREKSLFLGLRVTGTARVSGSLGEWEVNCTYGFSPITGLILSHTINSIEPAPHQTVYDALRVSLGGVFGHGYGVPGSERIEGQRTGTAFSQQTELQVQRVEVKGLDKKGQRQYNDGPWRFASYGFTVSHSNYYLTSALSLSFIPIQIYMNTDYMARLQFGVVYKSKVDVHNKSV